jgi:hypothetical protein
MITVVYSLPYNQVSFKASHNSYDRNEPLTQQLQWNRADPWQCGCRGLELDISQSSSGNQWSVSHDPGYSSGDPQLSEYLQQLQEWARQNPGHDVVTLYLDLKSVQKGFENGLDQYVSQYLACPVYRPADLMGSQPTVPDGARVNGWPTLTALADTFIIVLSGLADAKAAYAANDPRSRLCFADKSCGPSEVPQSNDRVFFNYHLYSDEANQWGPVFRGQATNPASICRGWVLNGESLWNTALNSGCNVLATDKVSNYEWAMVNPDAPFVQLKPLGPASTSAAAEPAGEAEPVPA